MHGKCQRKYRSKRKKSHGTSGTTPPITGGTYWRFGIRASDRLSLFCCRYTAIIGNPDRGEVKFWTKLWRKVSAMDAARVMILSCQWPDPAGAWPRVLQNTSARREPRLGRPSHFDFCGPPRAPPINAKIRFSRLQMLVSAVNRRVVGSNPTWSQSISFIFNMAVPNGSPCLSWLPDGHQDPQHYCSLQIGSAQYQLLTLQMPAAVDTLCPDVCAVQQQRAERLHLS